MRRISTLPTISVLINILMVPSGFAQGSQKPFQNPSLPPPMTAVAPSVVGMSPTHLVRIGEIIETEISKKQLPGAVVLVGRQGRIVWRQAYGNRALEPEPERMTPDTIFDLASLTKVVATATSIMILVERGRVRLADPVAVYIPEFAEMGKKSITVEQLLIHRSGLVADNELKDYEQGPEKAMEKIWRLAPLNEAGARFIYSDVNYIVLAEIVKRVSGRPIDQFAAENIFSPLGMKDTTYRPLERLGAQVRSRVAPTEKRSGPPTGEERWMRGEVHDPRAAWLGGVAGHAGLFSSADDLAIYCQMILNRGEYQGVRIMSPLTVARMTEARASGGNLRDGLARGLGWDLSTGYSGNRGDLFPVGSFGHTGFTGTSIWIDPSSEVFVIFLSNRVHPRLDPKKPAEVTSLRGRIASVVAASIMSPPMAARRGIEAQPAGPEAARAEAPELAVAPPALNGIDVLVRDGFKQLRGKRVGLITNQTGRDRHGRSTIDLLHQAPEVKLVAIFSPEHGLRGALDQEKIGNSRDEKTGLPIYSLYGESRRPSPEMLKEIEVLVFDIQDIGARFYTYISTLGLALEEAAKNKIPFVVLDRVNPINGLQVEGPVADADRLSFIAYHPIPVRHGLTVGELALLFNGERHLNADLQIVRVEDWNRASWFDETGFTWVNPSPNMRSLAEATLYPGICLLEPTNVSVGRGTDTPFELIGAPWIDERRLAKVLNETQLPGVRFVPVRFTPRASVHQNTECGGVNIVVVDRQRFEPVLTGLEIAVQLFKLFPKDFSSDRLNRLLVNQKVFDAFKQGADARAMRQVWEGDLDNFRAIRRKYLLY
ncbi:MAG TPA: exo-beta-N-acetylmuramidase NamZ domain-containing protein [Blastocatellia bacterium]|nr:exo-beta-N-acetylmuramidase NamZ domain-containing protein [Blastocatellia bacterium]